jgi:uncharacterized protein YjbI with pentapeptide repeats
MDMEDYARADLLSARALERAPESANAFLARAEVLQARESLVEALIAAEEAVRRKPGSKEAIGAAARLRFLVLGEATPGWRDYRNLFARKLSAPNCVAPDVDLSQSAFASADFTSAVLDRAQFISLVGVVDFSHAKLSGARFDKAGTRNAVGKRNSVSKFKADFINAILSRATFIGANIDAADFSGADLRDANFTGVTMEGVRFKGARLDGANFSNAQFYTTAFDGSDLGAADFSGAEAVNISWRGVDMSKATFSGADLKGGIVDCATKLPAGVDPEREGLFNIDSSCAASGSRRYRDMKWPMFLRLRDFDLAGADFSNNVFSNSELDNANLRGANFSGSTGSVSFFGADLTEAKFRGARLQTQFADMKRYDGAVGAAPRLERTDFSGAFLSASDFINDPNVASRFSVELSTAIFDGAELSCKAPFWRKEIGHFEDLGAQAQFGEAAESHLVLLKGWRQRAELARAALAAERDVVRYLAGRSASIVFDESCAEHLAAPAAASGPPLKGSAEN